ncbi:MAG: hypothetical protein ACI9FN_000368 [Saprospiraceae bacterium]|jgi:hypothetical protein
MLSQDLGKGLIVFGALLLLIGCVIYFGGAKLNWLGKLPGDIRIDRENFKIYFPFTIMIVLSVVVNLLIRMWRYFQ